MRTSTCLLPKFLTSAVTACAVVVITAAPLAAQVIHAGGADAAPIDDDGVIPASYQGSGSFFNRQLGTAFRLNYHTESYGNQDGVVALGAMKVFNMDGATWFLDGQGTLSDDFGGGFNLGVGYRALTNSTSPLMSSDPRRILGVSFWTDGQSTSADNFFTALGFSLESLGDSYDMRLNAQFPLDRTQAGDVVVTSIDDLNFVGSNLFRGTESFAVDTAHDVIDSEFAKRIADLEAWGFVGSYHIRSGGLDVDGYRAGVRGYAVPDLALSLQVTDDDVFHTNVVFGVTWFVGRTNKSNQPCGTLVDRFREPVLRNDYLVTTQRTINRSSGDAAIDPDTAAAKNFIFVNSNAAGAGDGTFENPFSSLTAAGGAQAENDTILAFSGSDFAGQTITLLNNVDLIGEGNDIAHICDTTNFGQVTLPETSLGAGSGAVPILSLAAGATGITAGDNNQINNFVIRNGATAVSAVNVLGPTLSNLDIDDSTGNSVVLMGLTGTTVVENTVTIDGALGTALVIDGGTDTVSTAATITNAAGQSLEIINRTGGTVTYSGTLDDMGGMGVSIQDNTASTINLTNALTLNTGANNGVTIAGNSDDTTITINDLDATAAAGNTVDIADGGTVTISSADATREIANTGTGDAFNNEHVAVGDDNAIITVNSNIDNSGGGNSVRITNRSENDVRLNGTIDDMGEGAFVMGNTGGTIGFNAQYTANVTGADNGVTLDTNAGAVIGFTGVAITAEAGTGFMATGGGDLAVTGAGNSIMTTTGVALDLQGMEINGSNVDFDTIDVTGGAGGGINLMNLDGTGTVALGSGTVAADGGTISTTGARAISIENADNVTIDLIDVTGAGANGLFVTGQDAGSTATITGLNVSGAGGDAIDINNNTGGTINLNGDMTINAGANDAIVINNNDGAAILSNNTSTIDLGNTTGSGVHLTGTNSNVNLGADITGGTGTSVDVEGDATATFGGNVTSTAGRSVQVHNVTAGTVSFNGNINDTDLGILIDANSGGNTNFNGVVTLNTGANNALEVSNNFAPGTTTVTFGAGSRLDIDTTSGDGIILVGRGTLSINGTGNTIDTDTGMGVALVNMDNFTLNNTTINTANNNAIDINHSSPRDANVALNNVTVASAGNIGMNVIANGTMEFDLTLNNVTIDQVGQQGILFDTSANANRVDFTITNSNVTAGDNSAFAATLNNADTADVRFVLDDNEFTNNSNSATVDLSVTSAMIFSARVGSLIVDEDPPAAPIGDNNRFVNNGAGDPFSLVLNNAGAIVNLDLRDNTAQGGGLTQYELTNTAGTFNLVDSVHTIAGDNNVGNVNSTGVITPIAPPVPAPTP